MKRITAIFLTLLMLAGALAACGTTPTPSVDTTVPGVTTAAPAEGESTPAETEKAEPKPYKPVEIELPADPNLLYNGIRLPEVWPPENISSKVFTEIPVPYLKEEDKGGNHPDVVDIDVGRQLFVDDFLIEKTDLTSTPHKAVKYEGNPVLSFPGSGTNLKHGAILYNAEKQIYEIFWNGSGGKLMYLSSKDGIKWNQADAYPVLVSPNGGGYMSVVYNETPDAANPRYLCLIRYSNGIWDRLDPKAKDHEHFPADIYYSDNRQTWRLLTNEAPTSGDATSMIYNPFRRTWIFSLRKTYSPFTRCRDYVECQDILDVADFHALDRVFWLRADSKDVRDESQPTFMPETSSVSAIAYESIMLGGFQMYVGPKNSVAHSTGIPKITNIALGYSRDGFHYYRPFREPIIESTKEKGSWERGYLHQINTVCVIVGDELRFYYGGYEGIETPGPEDSAANMMSNFGIGFATMRRDGFVSLDGSGEVVTRLMRFDEVNDRLFINAKAKSIRAEIRDADGRVIPGFSLDECNPFSGNSTCHELSFTSGKTLGELQGKDFSIRFVMEEGEFYAFWVSDTADGESGGFLAGGWDQR